MFVKLFYEKNLYVIDLYILSMKIHRNETKAGFKETDPVFTILINTIYLSHSAKEQLRYLVFRKNMIHLCL